MRGKTKVCNGFDKIISLYAYGATAALVIYMVGMLVMGVYDMMIDLPGLLRDSLDESTSTHVRQQMLHTVAFTIVLIKAYSVLIAYARRHHLNIKYILEIAIIAPIIELVFNLHSYAMWEAIFLGTLATVVAVIYLQKYQTIKQVDQDHKAHT